MNFVRVLILLIAALALGVAVSAHADQAAMGPSASRDLTIPDACTWETARELSIQDISRDYLALFGVCVRTSGVTDGVSIGPDAEAFKRAHFAHLGVLPEEGVLSYGRLREMEFFGVVGACQYVCPPPEEQIIRNADGSSTINWCMGRGVCHWFSEYPYLLARGYREVP